MRRFPEVIGAKKDRDRRRVMRLILFITAVLTALSGVELVLQIADIYPGIDRSLNYFERQRRHILCTPVFVRKKNGGKWQYYHKRRENGGIPLFADKKPDDEIRIFIVGESVAENLYNHEQDSDCQYNSEAISILSGRFPGKTVNIVPAGFGGYHSTEVLAVVREIVDYQPDLVLVLMGNNPTPGYKWQLAQLRRPPPLRWLYRISRFYSFACDSLYRLIFRGRTDFGDFEKDYRSVAAMLSERAVDFAAFRLPVNYADMPPAGYYRPEMEYIIPRLMKRKGTYEQMTEYIGSLNIRRDAVLHYLTGIGLKKSGDYDAAREQLRKALQYDEWMRADDKVNNVAEAVAEQYGGFVVRLDTFFEELTDHGLLGRELFYDNCHWYYRDLNPMVYRKLVHVLNRKEVARVMPVNEEALPDLEGLKMQFVELFREGKDLFPPDDNMDDFWNKSVFHAMVNLTEIAVYQMRYFHRNDGNLMQKLSDFSLNEDIIGRIEWLYGYDENQITEKLWYRALAVAGEAARLENDMEQAEILLDMAVNKALSAGAKAQGASDYRPFVFRGFLHVEVGAYDKGVADFERAAKIKGKTIAREMMLNFLKDEALPNIPSEVRESPLNRSHR